MTSAAFTASFSEEFIEGFADRLAQLIADEVRSPTIGACWMDVDTVADHLCTTPNSIRGMVKRRQIPVHRLPTGRLLFDRAEIDQWVRTGQGAELTRTLTGPTIGTHANGRALLATAPARQQEVES